MFGFVNINKPKGMTSHDVISILRKITKIKQIGHTGTLDPLATGVLPVAIGKASRLIEYLQEDKAYIADLLFGKVSDTYDSEGNIEAYSDKRVSYEQVVLGLQNFQGEIEQIPPAHSAVHYNGKRLYELARQGIIPDDIPKRKVFIRKCNLLTFDENSQTAKIEVECSKGTYIRSIISDLGMSLGSGAIMTGLIRTKSGLFDISNSIDITMETTKDEILSKVINPLTILPFAQKILSDNEYRLVQNGRAIISKDFENNQFVSLVCNGRLFAIAQKKIRKRYVND